MPGVVAISRGASRPVTSKTIVNLHSMISELNVDNWNDNCEAKSEAKSPRPLRGLQVD